MTEKQILDLINGFSASGLSDLDVSTGDFKISLRRYPRQEAVHAAPPPPPRPEAPPAQHSAPGSQGAQAPAPAPAPAASAHAAPGGEMISSPIVATFYRSPGPDSPAFAEPGKRIKAGQTLCILEAMKVMNEFPAEFDCEIVKVLPENGSLVEYGQPLFEVRRI
jgi:acetyl-CoA carboxylase biotin carboxyl carrier protein